MTAPKPSPNQPGTVGPKSHPSPGKLPPQPTHPALKPGAPKSN